MANSEVPDSLIEELGEISLDLTRQEENYFSRLCETALASVRQAINLSDGDIKKGIDTIKKSFVYKSGCLFSDVDYSQKENVWAYLVRYGPLSAGVTRHLLSSVLEASEDIRSHVFAKQKIRILNLGSGTGCDIVGLCSSFHKYVSNKSIHFTLVNSFKGWVSVFEIVERLLREGGYGNACEFFNNNDISTNYLQFDLRQDTSMNEEFEKSLEEADIIMLNRVLSIINLFDRIRIAKRIKKKMKKGAFLYLVDSPTVEEEISHVLSKFTQLSEISEDESKYVFQGPNVSNFLVAGESNAKIYVYLKN